MRIDNFDVKLMRIIFNLWNYCHRGVWGVEPIFKLKTNKIIDSIVKFWKWLSYRKW